MFQASSREDGRDLEEKDRLSRAAAWKPWWVQGEEMQVEATEKIGSERILRGGTRQQAQGGGGAPGERSERRFAATDVSVTQNLRSLLVALLLAGLVLLVAGALGLLIAASFYGYGGIG
jgi:hypothetical protein